MFSPLCPPMPGGSSLSQTPAPALSTSSSAASSVSGHRHRPRESSGKRRKERHGKRKRRPEEATMGLMEEGEVPAVPRGARHHRDKKKRQRERRNLLRKVGTLHSAPVEYDDVSSLSEGEQGQEASFTPALGLIPSPASDRCPSPPMLHQTPLPLLRQAVDSDKSGRRKRRRQASAPRNDGRGGGGGRTEDRRNRQAAGNLLLHAEPLMHVQPWRPQEESAKRTEVRAAASHRPKREEAASAASYSKQTPKAYRGDRSSSRASPQGNHRKKSASPARSPSPGYSGHRLGRRSPNYERTDTSPGRRRSRSPYSPATRAKEKENCKHNTES